MRSLRARLSFSLRTRLTLSYTALVAVALAVVAVLLARIAFDAMAHSTLDAVESSVRIAQTVVAMHPAMKARDVEGLIVIEASRDGVIVRLPPPGGGPGGSARGGGPPPDELRNSPRLDLATLLGLRIHHVRVGREEMLIAPDVNRLRPSISAYLWLLAGGLVLAVAIAWMVARWLAHQAIRPLLTVTAELRRFGEGDFTPRPVSTADREELGEMIAAYNAATSKVAAAFAERRSVEEHMRRFVADAGHELRTPLTVVDGYVQILRRASPDDAVVRERALATLQAQTARMRALVERLTVLARLERPEPSQRDRVDVAEIASDAVSTVRSARGGEIALSGADRAIVLGDAADVHEAISNLVDNAVKYGAGSPVHVTVADGDEVVVRVRDGGPGIPSGERARVFERFYRGDGRGDVDGSGLGLAIVERAVARCGGRVVLERAEPGDTAFALHLPAPRARTRDATPLEV